MTRYPAGHRRPRAYAPPSRATFAARLGRIAADRSRRVCGGRQSGTDGATTLGGVAFAENHLIALLPRRDRLSLLAACESVPLQLGAVLCNPGQAARHVYFPNDGFLSLVTAIDGEPALEVGMVGREGMLGAQLTLGVSAIPLRALVQGAGVARRIEAAPFRRELASSKALQGQLNRYLYVLMAQLATAAACTRFHSVGPRLARWLLMSQDRAHANSFHLTHEFLAYMLGVRRVGITHAAGDLQRGGLVRYHRGEITVLDRAGLEAAACSCYAADRDTYRRMFG
jgi:CRP-like cAMP-binding protein